MNARSTGRVLAILAVLAVGADSGCALRVSSGAGPAPTTTVTLPLEPYFRDLKTVTVSTGIGPLVLLLDTGGGTTLITPRVAIRIGCRPFGRDVGHRMTGEQVEFERCDALDVSVGDWRRRIQPVGVFDVNALLPAELPRLDGVLALDAFLGQVITIDWLSGSVRVHADSEAEPALRGHGVPVRIATGDNGRFCSVFVPVAAARGRLWFLLDSGNIRGTLLARHVVGQNLLEIGPAGEVMLTVGSRPSISMRADAADLVIDGTVGTAWLMLEPVTLDLRAVPARVP
ncbi:MAG: hypothetical protein WCP29_18065 [Acidobacteriota bacterium]